MRYFTGSTSSQAKQNQTETNLILTNFWADLETNKIYNICTESWPECKPPRITLHVAMLFCLYALDSLFLRRYICSIDPLRYISFPNFLHLFDLIFNIVCVVDDLMLRTNNHTHKIERKQMNVFFLFYLSSISGVTILNHRNPFFVILMRRENVFLNSQLPKPFDCSVMWTLYIYLKKLIPMKAT